jgi:hypothetical protein
LVVFVFAYLVEAAGFDPDVSVYLNFDEIDDGVIKDISGNGNDGVMTISSDLKDGKYGKVLNFISGLRAETKQKFFSPLNVRITNGGQ